MNKFSKKEKLGVILVITGIILFASNQAFGELEFETIVKDDTLTIFGVSDAPRAGVAIFDESNGMVLVTDSTDVIDGQFVLEIPFNYEPGNYRIMVGHEDEKQTKRFTIDPITEQIESLDQVKEKPYTGNVSSNMEKEEQEVIIDEDSKIKPAEAITEPRQIIEQEVKEIPTWVKNVFVMWTNNQISDAELITGITYLINIGVIQL